MDKRTEPQPDPPPLTDPADPVRSEVESGVATWVRLGHLADSLPGPRQLALASLLLRLTIERRWLPAETEQTAQDALALLEQITTPGQPLAQNLEGRTRQLLSEMPEERQAALLDVLRGLPGVEILPS